MIRSLTEAQEITTDVPGHSVACSVACDVDPKKVWPIQMDEFLRKCVSRRLLAVSVVFSQQISVFSSSSDRSTMTVL